MQRIILGLIGAAVLATALILLPAEQYAREVLSWINDLGFMGYGVFVLVYILFTVLFIPGFILTVGAGAVFGLIPGFLAVSVGSTVGAALAFLLGQTLARGWVSGKVKGNKRFEAIDDAVAREGSKIVFLTRLSPVFPFNLLNYAYGLTRIPFWRYTLASWVGMMPGTLLYVYVGALAGTVAKAATDAPEVGGFETAMRVTGFVATLVVTLYITKIARKALKQETDIKK